MTDLSEKGQAWQRRQQSVARPVGEAAKRALDIVLSAAALVVLAPLLVVLWLLVRWTSPGPGLFRQERLGRGMRPFRMLKLRSMYIGDSDRIHREYVAGLLSGDQGPGPRGLFKLETDPRITRVGAWLRRTSLDELPQLFNVLRGDMSLVGPRSGAAVGGGDVALGLLGVPAPVRGQAGHHRTVAGERAQQAVSGRVAQA